MEPSLIVWIIIAYLFGAFSPSYFLGRWTKGIDLREHGSGNLGMTNAWRVLGHWQGATVLVVDVLKGMLPALLFYRWIGAGTTEALGGALNVKIMMGIAAILGHCFPFYLGFRGGKGVLTGLGAFIVIAPIPILTALIVGVLLIATLRIVSVASMVGGIVFFIVSVAVYLPRDEHIFIIVSLCLALFVFYTHRTNLRRLLKGEEGRLGEKKSTEQANS